ncbi:hypothetical protein HOF56_01255 [Candidatus Peribacteria bacterium]|jgi:hypothetical protein|nr:hypothetical protein [Candidatus Peribacteria bacterium]MBT4021204.1 hypothetical protein [Candidatus Peribacteria bacterium]MBT4240598.1 hypothetical protein [Candidatus Peribacteria bacterium]MBT4474667.1 hypothetical protein [Candidatus Peribacteria bacterium]
MMLSKLFKTCASIVMIIMISGCSKGPETVAEESAPIPTNPEARTARLTSYILIRKTEKLRDKAIYLKHREEGERLLRFLEDGKDGKE